jgi:hypothetical protein
MLFQSSPHQASLHSHNWIVPSRIIGRAIKDFRSDRAFLQIVRMTVKLPFYDKLKELLCTP